MPWEAYIPFTSNPNIILQCALGKTATPIRKKARGGRAKREDGGSLSVWGYRGWGRGELKDCGWLPCCPCFVLRTKTGRAHAILGRRLWRVLDDLRAFGARGSIETMVWKARRHNKGLKGDRMLLEEAASERMGSAGGGVDVRVRRHGRKEERATNQIDEITPYESWRTDRRSLKWPDVSDDSRRAHSVPTRSARVNLYKATSGAASASKRDIMPGSGIQGLGNGTRHDLPHQAITEIFRFADRSALSRDPPALVQAGMESGGERWFFQHLKPKFSLSSIDLPR
ncbi:hypothetical protein DFH09DRAFT_1097296 [Mycena vulgaris]|nr:hypothetical protein DFH09DRAFT_1097296 [Mycena vulgaris]